MSLSSQHAAERGNSGSAGTVLAALITTTELSSGIGQQLHHISVEFYPNNVRRLRVLYPKDLQCRCCIAVTTLHTSPTVHFPPLISCQLISPLFSIPTFPSLPSPPIPYRPSPFPFPPLSSSPLFSPHPSPLTMDWLAMISLVLLGAYF